MAIKQTLIHRMFTICNNNFSNQTLRNCRISPSSTATTTTASAAAAQVFMPPNPDSTAPDPGDETVFRRFLDRNQSMPEIFRPRGESMLERLKEIDITRGRIRLDVLSPPPPAEITVADAKKILRVSQIEKVVKAIYGLLPPNSPATRKPLVKELEEMERWKTAIDTKAKKMVQRELWGGLAYLMVQTAAFMRLTFWELSWDVMEPICFYVTSAYFMGGYMFFLRTTKEPSFEGIFQSRFSSKQKKLMKREGFDLEKYEELRQACYPRHEAWPSETSGLKS